MSKIFKANDVSGYSRQSLPGSISNSNEADYVSDEAVLMDNWDMTGKEQKMALGALIKAYRERAGLTRKQLSADVSIPERTIVNVEGGQQGLAVERAIAVAEFLSIPLAEMADAVRLRQSNSRSSSRGEMLFDKNDPEQNAKVVLMELASRMNLRVVPADVEGAASLRADASHFIHDDTKKDFGIAQIFTELRDWVERSNGDVNAMGVRRRIDDVFKAAHELSSIEVLDALEASDLLSADIVDKLDRRTRNLGDEQVVELVRIGVIKALYDFVLPELELKALRRINDLFEELGGRWDRYVKSGSIFDDDAEVRLRRLRSFRLGLIELARSRQAPNLSDLSKFPRLDIVDAKIEKGLIDELFSMLSMWQDDDEDA